MCGDCLCFDLCDDDPAADEGMSGSVLAIHVYRRLLHRIYRKAICTRSGSGAVKRKEANWSSGMTKELFVATSYHHVLTAIAKKYANQSAMDLFISNRSTGDEYWNLYLGQMKANKWFDHIFFFDERILGPPSPAHPLATYRYELGGEKKRIVQIPNLNLKQYDLIYLIDDKMFLGSTVVRDKLPYHLCEDTVLTYQIMKKAKSSKVLNAPYNIICPVLKALNYWHPVFGYGESCKAIESSR